MPRRTRCPDEQDAQTNKMPRCPARCPGKQDAQMPSKMPRRTRCPDAQQDAQADKMPQDKMTFQRKFNFGKRLKKQKRKRAEKKAALNKNESIDVSPEKKQKIEQKELNFEFDDDFASALNNADNESSESESEVEEMKEDESALKDSNLPKTVDDWEALVVKNKRSSLLWIGYAKFYTNLSDVEKSKSILNRGLESIPLEEENERLNLFITLLSIESKFGSDDTFLKTLKSTSQRTDSITIYKKALNILKPHPTKANLLKTVLKNSIKKFPSEIYFWKFWINYECENLNDFQNAKQILDRGIKILPKKKHHVELLLTLAKIELVNENQAIFEHGRTILEKVLSTYKRDISSWKFYIKILKNKNDISGVRSIYERATSQKFSKKVLLKMLKEWMNFEIENKNLEMQSLVRYKCNEIEGDGEKEHMEDNSDADIDAVVDESDQSD